MAWEYVYVQASTTSASVQATIDATNKLGALGWEVVGITTADRTIGANTNLLILKRAFEPPPPPTSTDEWQPDPCGRFELVLSSTLRAFPEILKCTRA